MQIDADGTVGEVESRSYLLQFFEYEHLPEKLQEISRPFNILAKLLATSLPNVEERSMALRKLLEAKDCAVRARIQVGG